MHVFMKYEVAKKLLPKQKPNPPKPLASALAYLVHKPKPKCKYFAM